MIVNIIIDFYLFATDDYFWENLNFHPLLDQKLRNSVNF